MTVPKVGQYADGVLSPNEFVQVPFILCLKTRQQFQFFVDVFGVVAKLISVNLTGTAAGGRVLAISADGRFVVFDSTAADLAPNDNNGTFDVFVRDVQNGTTTLVSVNRFGTGSGDSQSELFTPAISANGRFVAFFSHASDLVPGDTNQTFDMFVRDLELGTTTRFASPATAPAFSADRFLAFVSNEDVFVSDMLTGTTTLVSVNITGTASGNSGDQLSGPPAISADGRFVVFGSRSSDLVANDTNGANDVFVRDMLMGTTTLVSINRFGTGSGDADSTLPVITADGRLVVFTSRAGNLVPNDNNASVPTRACTPVQAAVAGTSSHGTSRLEPLRWSASIDSEPAAGTA
jgi:Tol biopolymer transport system component